MSDTASFRDLEYPSLQIDADGYPVLPDSILKHCLPKVPGQSFIQAQLEWFRVETHLDFPNSRSVVSDTGMLEEGVETLGLESPLVVWRHYSEVPWVVDGVEYHNRFFLISGFRRHRSLEHLCLLDAAEFDHRFPRIPVHIFQGDLIEAMMHNLSENANRKNPTAVEFGNYVVSLLDQGLKKTEIADRSGVSKAWVSNCHSLITHENLSSEVKDALNDRIIDIKTAQALIMDTLDDQAWWVEDYKRLLSTGQVKKAKEKKKKKKVGTPRSRKADVLEVERDRFLSQDLTSREASMRTLWGQLDEDQKLLAADMMSLSHIYGVQKTFIFACNEDVSWDAPRPPFVFDPITKKIGESVARKTLAERAPEPKE